MLRYEAQNPDYVCESIFQPRRGTDAVYECASGSSFPSEAPYVGVLSSEPRLRLGVYLLGEKGF